MAEFPWQSALETGGVFAIAMTLLYLLVDSYKQLASQRQVIAELTLAMSLKLEGLGASLTNVCTVLGGAVQGVEKALEDHDDRVKGIVGAVEENSKKLDAERLLLEKMKDDVGRIAK
jgi:hypothetical protein